MKIYNRRCDKCDKVYQTTHKYGKQCDDCCADKKGKHKRLFTVMVSNIQFSHVEEFHAEQRRHIIQGRIRYTEPKYQKQKQQYKGIIKEV